jgi:hypothetical protein
MFYDHLIDVLITMGLCCKLGIVIEVKNVHLLKSLWMR